MTPEKRAAMAIEGMYQDVENTSSPMRRRASTRRPLGALNANNIMSPTHKSASKPMQKPVADAEARAVNQTAAPVFSIDPEVSPWTVPDSPVRCPLDEKEVARKRGSPSGLVLPALAIGSVLALLAAPHMTGVEQSDAMVQPSSILQPDMDVHQSLFEQAMEDLVVSYRHHDSNAPPGSPSDDFLAQPVEISSDDTTEVAHLQYQEAVGPADDDDIEPFENDDDWAPLSVQDLEAISAAYDDLEPSGASEDESLLPWEACMMSGPLHIPQTAEELGMPEFAGFARLTASGELYLFEEADSEIPVGMMALDGCVAASWPEGACFDLKTLSGSYQGCVSDQDEAADWAHAAAQVPCNN